MDDDIPYLLLTPGPLSTSRTVRQAMQQDFCTWDDDYNKIVTGIRERLVRLVGSTNDHTAVLMQGSGTFSVEATVGSVIPADGKLLVISNGAYGDRIARIAHRLKIHHTELKFLETEPPRLNEIRDALANDTGITHVAVVHCETTTGMLNPVADIGKLTHEFGKTFIVDAMSSFGGMPMTMDELHADFLISSANKCVQGTPGFGFVIARRVTLESAKGRARSLSLDLYDQWQEMETKAGKWRYTSPTHVVRAFQQALEELEWEGGVSARHARYIHNQTLLIDSMTAMGFKALLPRRHQSHFITSFHYPETPKFEFVRFYEALKRRRFVIYPGKVTGAETFRIGNIGHVFPDDIRSLAKAISEVVVELGLVLPVDLPTPTVSRPGAATALAADAEDRATKVRETTISQNQSRVEM